MKRILIAIVVLAAVAFAADQPKLQNAKVVAGSGANLSAEVDHLKGENAWIAWSVPMIAGDHQMCCFNQYDGVTTNCGCSLGNRDGGSITSDSSAARNQHLEGAANFYVFLRTEGGQLQKVRTFGADCPIDGDGMTVHWLADVRPADSVALLTSLIGSSDQEDRHDRIGSSAVMAIAFTNDPSADRAMDNLLAPAQSVSIRKKAAFWTAQLRGKAGVAKLIELMRKDSDERFRSDLTFDLTQSKLPEAEAELMRAAREDSSSKVRSQALFWLAQRAGKKVAGAITEAIENDPDTSVKKRAVFALTQMPDSEGVPLLIQVAKSNTNPVVRKQAMFWLGQSHDPRALDFIEAVLKQ